MNVKTDNQTLTSKCPALALVLGALLLAPATEVRPCPALPANWPHVLPSAGQAGAVHAASI
jgi:hypothetical protein